MQGMLLKATNHEVARKVIVLKGQKIFQLVVPFWLHAELKYKVSISEAFVMSALCSYNKLEGAFSSRFL